MTTPTAGARASRRSAARQAATAPVPTPTAAPTPVETPEALADLMSADDDEAFGPDDVVVPGPESAANSAPASRVADRSSVAVRQDKMQHGAAGGSLALPMEDLTRKIDASDLIIPKLRLSQAMSKTNTVFATSRGTQGVGMGNWYVSSKNENLGETVWFLPVDMRKSRSYFVQGQGLMCRSFDMLNGEGDPGGSCQGSYEEMLTVPAEHRGCPLRLWNDKTPPKCGQTYNIPGFVIPNIEEPNNITQVILQLRSTATQAAKSIITFVMNEGGRVWQNVIFELGVESKTNPRGTFFVPTVEFYDLTDEAPEYARLKRRADSMARALGAVTLRASLEDDAE